MSEKECERLCDTRLCVTAVWHNLDRGVPQVSLLEPSIVILKINVKELSISMSFISQTARFWNINKIVKALTLGILPTDGTGSNFCTF